MLRRLLAFVAFSLLLAAALATFARYTPFTAQNAEPTPLSFYDMSGVVGAADLSSEEPEPLQTSAPTTRIAIARNQWLTATHTAWPVRAPDELLRPPMALPVT